MPALVERDGDRTRIFPQTRRLDAGTTRRLAPEIGTPMAPNVSVHLNSIEFVEPFGLLYLYWFLRQILLRGRHELEVILPDDAGPRNYLARMHLPECLADPEVRFTPLKDEWEIVEQDRSESLVELETFSVVNEDEVEDLASRTVEIILRSDPEIGVETELLHLSLAEVISNIQVHSASDHGTLAVQRYDARVHMAFGDGGIGIPRALESKVSPGSTDAEVIRMALEEGVTSRPGDSGGLGLSELVFAVQRVGTRINIRSGRGHVCVDRDGYRADDDCREIGGTIIEVVW